MTQASDLMTLVRRGLRDFGKWRTDTGTGDGASTFFDLGKDVAVMSVPAETISVNAVKLTRGPDYAIDYDANQVVFTNPPGNALAIKATYKEAVWRDELVLDAVNAGRRMLFPKFYQRDSATITIRNNVRDYQLDSADVNEPAMRTVFGQGPGSFKILARRVQPLGASVDQFWRPFRRTWMEWRGGHPFIHLSAALGVSDILRLDVMFAYTPLVTAIDQTDIPDRLFDLVTFWALSTLALKQEPQRNRIDTAAVAQSAFANPAGTMGQTAEDFQTKFWAMFKTLNSEPPVFELQDIPLPFEAR